MNYWSQSYSDFVNLELEEQIDRYLEKESNCYASAWAMAEAEGLGAGRVEEILGSDTLLRQSAYDILCQKHPLMRHLEDIWNGLEERALSTDRDKEQDIEGPEL